MKFHMRKDSGGILLPADDEAAELLQKIKTGSYVTVEIKRKNNYKFHRKLYALANFAYEQWEPEAQQYKGMVVAKNFDQFRDDITILAGFYTTAVRLDGSIRFIARSWSFDSMDDEEKERLYNGIINVALAKILTRYSRDDIDNVINKLLGFV